jgi:SET domain-containing protein
VYDKEYYKNWYEKNKEKQKIWQKEYYRKHKEHLLEMHKDWAKRNVDHTGSVWRLYGRRRRNKNPNIDKEYRLRRKARLMYKPLSDNLTIATSGINGLGLFAKESIPQGTNLGMTHLELGQKIIRTPLGGFINHSNTPNCVKIKLLLTRQEWNHRADLPDNKFNIDFKKWNLMTLQDIKEGEELTVRYTFYNV